MSNESKLVFKFVMIRKKVDELLTWMKSRLEGQKYFNFTISDTISIAKDLITKAVNDHRQQEELRLMREAEDETIAYNIWLKEKEEKEKQEADELRKLEEEKKKAEEDKKGASKRK